MVKIHILESMGLSEEQRRRLNALGETRYFEGVPDAEELLKRAGGADVLAFDWAPMDSAIPKLGSGVRLLSVPFSGVGFLPLKEAKSRGILVANTPGYATESVGEFGIGLMLALVRQLDVYSRSQPKPEVTMALYGKTVGVLGVGRMPSISDMAKKLGMKVVYFKRGKRLSTLLKRADVVYCALPFSEETKGLPAGRNSG